jgi:hypothetical protein
MTYAKRGRKVGGRIRIKEGDEEFDG